MFFIPTLFWIWHFVQDQWLQSRDTMHLIYVAKRWCWTHILNGEMPLWNDGLFGGFYQLASPALGLFTPFTALFYSVFPSFHAEQLQLPLFSILAAIGAYHLARALDVEKTPALVMAVAYSLSGPLISLADRSPFFYAAALYPLFFFFALRFCRDTNTHRLSGLATALLLSFIIINGDWTGGVFFGAALLFLLVKYKNHFDNIDYWPLILSFGLVAISVWPAIENIEETARASGLTYAEASHFSLHPLRLFSLVVPELWGYPYDWSFWGHAVSSGPYSPRFWFHSIYLGSLVMILGVFGWWHLKAKSKIILTTVLLFFVFLSFGTHSFLHKIVFDHIPLYNRLRYPEKFLLFSVFVWLVFACFGAREVHRKNNWHYVVRGIGVWHGIAALITLHALPGLDALQTTYKLSNESALIALKHMSSGLFVHAVCLVLVLLAIARPKINTVGILLVLTAIELTGFMPAFQWAPSQQFTEPGVFAAELANKTARFSLDPIIMPEQHRRLYMVANWPELDNIRDSWGYDTVPPIRRQSIPAEQIFQRLDVWSRILQIDHVVTFASPRNTDLKRFADDGLLEPVRIDTRTNLALLKWKQPVPEAELFSTFEVASTSKAAIRRVLVRGAEKGAVVLEERPTAGAFTDAPVNGTWEKTGGTTSTATFRVTVDKDSFFVVRSSYHKGWTATIDRATTTVYRADALSRAVMVPAGEHEVHFAFQPPLFFWGSIVSFISALIALGMGAYFIFRSYFANDRE